MAPWLQVFRTALGACPLAIRGKDPRERVRLPGSQAARQDSDIPKAGDVVLLEADERYVESKLWQEAPCFFLSRSTAAATTRLQQQPLQTVVLAAQEFSITKIVANSSPQRVGGVHDQLRPSGLQRGQWDSVLRLVPIFRWIGHDQRQGWLPSAHQGCVMVCLGMAVLVVMLTAEIVDLACGAGLLATRRRKPEAKVRGRDIATC